MRILYLTYGTQSGVTQAVVERLRAVGHDVLLFNALDGFLYKRTLGPIQVPNLRPAAVLAAAAAVRRFGRNWKLWYVHTCWAFDRLTARCDRAIEEVRPDAVLQAGALFAPGSCPSTRYYLYCDHTRALNEAYPAIEGVEPPIPFEAAWRRREAAVYRRASAVFTMSEHVRRSLVDVYGVDPDRVHVVGAGPNAEPGGATGSARREPSAFLFVGRQFAPKGGPELLAAFAALRGSRPDAELWMVGGQQPGRAPPGVRLLGRRSIAEVARLYERGTVFVLPTLREAFGLAFLEAMAFGLPCIGTAVEAIPEIVIHGETGLLVPPGAPGALTQAMRALLQDPARARAMGAAGRERVRRCFGWDRAVERMTEVLARQRPSPVAAAPAHHQPGWTL